MKKIIILGVILCYLLALLGLGVFIYEVFYGFYVVADTLFINIGL